MKCAFILAVLFSLHLGYSKQGLASEALQPLTLASVDWKPLNSPDLDNDGYIAEIVREALLRSGYTLTIKWAPWNRVLEISKIGGYDGILAAFYQKDREPYFEYSNHIGYEEFTFWQRSESSYRYNTLANFSGTSVGVLLGSSYSLDLKKQKGLDVQEVTSDRQNILKLAHGRIDLFLASFVNVNYILNHELPAYEHKIKTVKPSYARLKLYMLISKKHPNHKSLVNRFNSSLDDMIKDGTYKAILLRHNVPVMSPPAGSF